MRAGKLEGTVLFLGAEGRAFLRACARGFSLHKKITVCVPDGWLYFSCVCLFFSKYSAGKSFWGKQRAIFECIIEKNKASKKKHNNSPDTLGGVSGVNYTDAYFRN
jgi:hypothetical protein